jgi:diadenylate cyclase
VALTGTQGDDLLRETLALVAPGTVLRDGLDRILRGRTGALIVLGLDPMVESMCSGGFELDISFSAARLRELSKMDGAVVIDPASNKIRRAAVQLLPDPSIPTVESGTRHRTAERVAVQSGFPVISVSQSMRIIGLYVNGRRHVIEDSDTILGRANQALATLERYRVRLDEVAGTLSALEIEDLVTLRDVCSVVQRLEMVRRISQEIREYVVELGVDGRLLSLQLNELSGGIESDEDLVIRDYVSAAERDHNALADVLARLAALDSTQLLDLGQISEILSPKGTQVMLDAAVAPQGFRLLSKVPRLPQAIVERVVTHFGGLQKLLACTTDDLLSIDGVGEQRARTVREGLSRLAESSILDRYV